MTISEVALTPQQEEAAERSPDSSTLVIAPAGTGKTEVLVARIAYLVEEVGLRPGSELLVLSFSRSAVRVITERVRLATGRASYTRAVTFDSFATSLLASISPNGDWNQQGYDGRIQAAIRALRSDTEAKDLLAETRHVLVDEVQDLVGARRDLVAAVLDTTPGGFTLLGDPSQAIYDWQENEPDGVASEPIAVWLTRQTECDTLVLEKNFRALTPATREVIELGPWVVGAGRSAAREAAKRVNSFVGALPRLKSMEQASFALKNDSRTSAVLCRTNGQALAVSSQLHELGVPHRLQRRAVDRAIHPWVGSFFASLNNTTVSRRGFERRFEEVVNDVGGPTPSEGWRLLKTLDKRGRDSFDVRTVAERIRVGWVPDQLSWTQNSPVVVSTVHRAKGLEFDGVLLLEPSDLPTDPEQALGELRVTYVGLTRARRDLAILERPTHQFRYHSDVDRWVHRGWNSWQRFGIEVRGDDVHRGHPGGGYLLETEDAVDTQGYLAEKVAPGDPVTLRLVKSSKVGLPRAFYGIFHDGRPVGVTSEAFGQDLYTALKESERWEVRWPGGIAGLRVEAVDTVSGSSAAGSNSGLGPSGIWLRARVGGMGRFIWKDDES